MNLSRRFLSTTRNRTYLPSVEWLISKHRLTPSTVAGIQATGPQNRLLKGDMLAYLAGDVLMQPFEKYFQIDLWLRDLPADTVSTYLSMACMETLQKDGDLAPVDTIVSIISDGRKNKFDLGFPAPKPTTLPGGPVRIVDLLDLGVRAEPPTWHLQRNTTVVVSFTALDSFSKAKFEVEGGSGWDSMVGDEEARDEGDLIDFLAGKRRIIGGVRVNMTVDGRVVMDEDVKRFLRNVESRFVKRIK